MPSSHAFDVLGQSTDFLNGILSLIATLFALALATLRLVPAARLWLVTSHLTAPKFSRRASDTPLPSPDRIRVFRRVATEVARGDTVAAAEAVSRVFPDMHLRDPWSCDGPITLLEWCEVVSRPGRESFLGRLAAPDQLAVVRSFVADVFDYLDHFARLAMAPARVDRDATLAFASHLSGAAVLLDASDSRSGVASDVVVRHGVGFRGNRTDWGRPGVESAGYADRHPRRGAGAEQDDRLGDYDGRLPDVVGAGVATSFIDGAVAFVLDTTETCYRTSEKPGELGCKRLAASSDDPWTPRFEEQENGWVVRTHVERQRVSILTSYVSLLARSNVSPTGDYEGDVLVLCRRSAHTRNGQGTLSAAAGGLVELGADLSMDVTRAGAPDPIAAVMRECSEELGVRLDRRRVNPACVFLCTVQGRDPSADDMSVRARGQLVTVVLSLAAVPLTLQQLRDEQRLADHAVGGFEVDSLEGILMPAGPDGCREFVAEVASLSPVLDQHGLLSCFYAAIRTYGRDEAVRCFSAGFTDPWWSEPWSGETAVPRVCRDPRMIVDMAHPADRPSDWPDLSPMLQAEATPHA